MDLKLEEKGQVSGRSESLAAENKDAFCSKIYCNFFGRFADFV